MYTGLYNLLWWTTFMNCIYWSFCFSNRFHLCKVLNVILKQLFLKQLLFLLNYLKFCVVFCGWFFFSFFFFFFFTKGCVMWFLRWSCQELGCFACRQRACINELGLVSCSAKWGWRRGTVLLIPFHCREYWGYLAGIQYLILRTAFKATIKEEKKKREMKLNFIYIVFFHWLC